MTPDVCMRFLVWSYYYHGIEPKPGVSYTTYAKFSQNDAARLDEMKETMFRCFEPETISASCARLYEAKQLKEPCPYTQSQLDEMFAYEIE